MDNSTKERLKNIERSPCVKCGQKRNYTNPLERCFFCKKKFYFDHITGGVITNDMKENDEIRNACDDCLKTYT